MKADAGAVAKVGAEGWDAGVATGFVEALGFGLADAGFEEDEFVAEDAGVAFEGGDDEAAEALAAGRGDDVHALEFGAIRIEGAEGAASDGFVTAASDEEDAFVGAGFLRREGAGRASVASGYFGAESVDQLAGGRADGIFDGDGKGLNGSGRFAMLTFDHRNERFSDKSWCLSRRLHR